MRRRRFLSNNIELIITPQGFPAHDAESPYLRAIVRTRRSKALEVMGVLAS